MKKALCAVLAAVLTLSLLSACAGETQQEPVDLSAFAQTLRETYEFAQHLSAMDPDAEEFAKQSIEQYLPGLLDMDLEQRVICMSMMRLNNGEFSLVQTKNAQDAETVKELFQNRVDYMVGDGESPGGAWYPGPTELWRNSSRVVSHGNYVMMVVAEECGQIVDEFNALFE